MNIRTATKNDAPALLDIYSYYVLNTAITFEYFVPNLEEFEKRIETTLLKYPYLVLEEDGAVLGYAYASTFHEREAYQYSVETSIYVKNGIQKKGYGKALYAALEKELLKQQIQNVYACIAYTEKEDAYLTNNSYEFHKHLGYKLAGTFHKCGYKFQRYYDMVWMEKEISCHPKNPKPFIPYSKL